MDDTLAAHAFEVLKVNNFENVINTFFLLIILISSSLISVLLLLLLLPLSSISRYAPCWVHLITSSI